MVGRTFIMAIIGGIFAKLGGGKFANGALSAAFVHLFNDEFDYLYLRGKGVARALGGDGKCGDPATLKNVKTFTTETKQGLIKGLKITRKTSGYMAYASGLAGQPEGVALFTGARLTSDWLISVLGGQDNMAFYRHGLIDVATEYIPNTPIPAKLLIRDYVKSQGDNYANTH